MAKLPRLYIPGQPQHVILPGLDDRPAFVDEVDCNIFVNCLRDAVRRYETGIHAWALLPGGVHLVATPANETALSLTMQAIGRRYVAIYNARHDRSGPLWAGRYRATVIEPERYLLMASRLVERAPVRAGLATAPENYRWSSYRHHAGLCTDPIVSEHALFEALGSTPFERHHAWKHLCGQPLDEGEVATLMAATLKGWALGSGTYLAWASGRANRRISRLPRGPQRKSPEAPAQPQDKPAHCQTDYPYHDRANPR
ncbi:transposase [Paraburkholderia saeva]|nr:transposase [Paraburkholderia saeva]